MNGGILNHRHRCHARRRLRAFTLVELVISSAIGSVLLVVMGGAVILSARAQPDSNDPLIAGTQAAQALDLMAGEIESAVYVSSLTSTAISFTVADRNNDGIPERISYSWSGVVGDPLLRAYNGGTSVAVVDHVNAFTMAPSLKYVSESYPGPGVEDTFASVLQDCTGSSGGGNQSMGSTNQVNFGQYFAPSTASGVIGWRPTSVSISVEQKHTPGTFRVQMRPAVATLLPMSAVLEEILVNSSTLPTSASMQKYTFTTLARQAPGNGLCLALMWDSGSAPAKFQTNNNAQGFLQTSSGTTNWSYDSGHAITSQLSGVAMRSTATRTMTTQYLLGVTIALSAGPSGSPTVHGSAMTLNHPELVGGLLELKFDRDPTTVEVNGDGAADWYVASGSFSSSSLSAGTWTTSYTTLTSRNATEYNVGTVADVRMQSAATGASANFALNTARSGSQYVGLVASLALQSDGTQTLVITQATGSSTSTPLITYAGLPAQPTDVHLVVDPVAMGVAVSVNGVQRGTFPVSRITGSTTTSLASLYPSGGSAQFSYARVRILRTMP